MTDLRTLRLRSSRPSVELTPGVTLYADRIAFLDKRKRVGEAEGRVFLDVGPEARHAWMLEYGYAQAARFNRRNGWVILRGEAMLEREKMTQIATEPYTEMEVRWGAVVSEVILRGPIRADFAKSNPLPQGVTVLVGRPDPSARPAAPPVRKSRLLSAKN